MAGQERTLPKVTLLGVPGRSVQGTFPHFRLLAGNRHQVEEHALRGEACISSSTACNRQIPCPSISLHGHQVTGLRPNPDRHFGGKYGFHNKGVSSRLFVPARGCVSIALRVNMRSPDRAPKAYPAKQADSSRDSKILREPISNSNAMAAPMPLR